MSAAKRLPSAAVIGAGWAGCTAAVELAAAGCRVTLFEAARTLGGRARSVEVHGKTLDNGQHIMLGAYKDTLRLLRRVGIDPSSALLHLPLQMRYPLGSGMDFVAPRLPAPFHLAIALLRAKGLAREDKMALARFSTSARWMDWTLYADCSVTELLDRFDQTPRLVALMWRPLCLAALNTPPERASAQVFLNVLRDSLGARRHASDMLVPRLALGALFPQAAAAFIDQRGGDVRGGARVDKVERSGAAWRVHTASSSDEFDAVVVATPPAVAGALLDAQLPQPLPSFDHEPITTCYLQYPENTRLALPFYALEDDREAGHWGQFLFDRGQLDATQAGLLAVVISASSDAASLGHDELCTAVARQVASVLGRPELAAPQWSRAITEKRATFACTPGLVRPGNDIGLPSLFLAGDYTANDYPATLEGAVRSGSAAARAVLAATTA
ncbi:hydroxysqualene dehydroxylase HpnE [Massilia cavernae]|uniref:FAD-dependent oxidoreductase n=1 Tax=Massilia cavernae TaxID=2320864 RepID=A0A418XR16_9BURK|nr:hydroxysqualene dehydroxylase HpnE [Massilia cavernae]RJG14905.1 FAD-dependent oxidoreductase [Massilia cavernae]